MDQLYRKVRGFALSDALHNVKVTNLDIEPNNYPIFFEYFLADGGWVIVLEVRGRDIHLGRWSIEDDWICVDTSPPRLLGPNYPPAPLNPRRELLLNIQSGVHYIQPTIAVGGATPLIGVQIESLEQREISSIQRIQAGV